MTPEETQKLIDHLDESLTGKSSGKPESLVSDDPEATQEWYCLNVAVDAVRNAALHEQVATIRKSLGAPANQTTVIRTIGRYGMRAAATILIVASSTIIYKYVTVSSSSLYNRYFTSYELNTSRGQSSETPVMQAYNAGNWKSVIALAAKTALKDNQTEFLAGMADLRLGQSDDAITHFEQVIAANAQASTDYYQDEAEYYLAISWLACKKVNEAMPILEKIKADPNHKYHQKVEKMSFFDLRLAQYKENK